MRLFTIISNASQSYSANYQSKQTCRNLFANWGPLYIRGVVGTSVDFDSAQRSLSGMGFLKKNHLHDGIFHHNRYPNWYAKIVEVEIIDDFKKQLDDLKISID